MMVSHVSHVCIYIYIPNRRSQKNNDHHNGQESARISPLISRENLRQELKETHQPGNIIPCLWIYHDIPISLDVLI